MGSQSLQNNSSGEFRNKRILTDWLEAISDFHVNYQDLMTIIDKHEAKPDRCKKDGMYIGQCSTDSLITLVLTMHRELEKLVQMLDQFNWHSHPDTSQHYTELTEHTRILNQLNQKAQILLTLISVSSS